MKYGYARVSTKLQKKEGNSLEDQERRLKEEGCEKIYADDYTGTSKDRPKLNALLDEIKAGDTLVVTKLDRLARSLVHGKELIDTLIKKGVTVNVLNLGVMDNNPTSEFIRNIFFSFAEFERNMIIERTREGREIAKEKKDYQEGRPKKYRGKQIAHALSLLETHTYKEVDEITGISKSTLIRAKREIELNNALDLLEKYDIDEVIARTGVDRDKLIKAKDKFKKK